jgi:hypothetical protein
MPLGQLHMPRPEDRPQAGGGHNNQGGNHQGGTRDGDGRGGRRDDDHNGRDWRDRRNDRDHEWHGWRDRDRWHDHDRSRWSHRDSWRHHNSHHHHSSWLSFSFGPSYSYGYWPSYSYSRPLLYSSYSYSPWSSSYCAPRYYTYSDPLCVSYRPSYSYWWYYQRPLSYSLIYPAYDTTTYISYETPVYTETATYLYGTDIPSYSSSTTILDYSAKLPTDYRAYVTTESAPTYSAPAASEEPIILYQATRDGGEMVWSDTPTSIVNALLNSTDRGREAQRFLGKSIAGAWEVTLENARRTETGMELTTRGTTAAGTGVRPTIIVNLRRVELGLETGQRLSITGRLSELTVNDPENAGGLLVLDDADVSW